MSLFRSPISVQRRPPDGSMAQDRISLVDSTAAEADSESGLDSESGGLSRAPSTVAPATGRRKQLRQELARRKYAKYQEDSRAGQPSEMAPSLSSNQEQVSSRVQPLDNSKTRDASGPSVAVDILYENQRGSFLGGIPLFSHKSLLNFDPAPWVNASFKDSPVNITNAQVPDPSWKWAWKSWYVDMSTDVDEEGWQYSFSFQKSFSWHGTHVWYHSFVGRRRWLRKRVKKEIGRVPDTASNKAMAEAHMLNDDYFTIHAGRFRAGPASVATGGSRSMDGTGHNQRRHADQDDQDKTELRDVGSLLCLLKAASIDREKVEAVKNFLDHGGEEVAYLAEKIPYIMSLLIFQYSRRLLLSSLVGRFNDASKIQDGSHSRNEAGKVELDALRRAVEAADREVKRLEYWSDVRQMVQRGETKGALDHTQGWGHEWQGVDASGPSAVSERSKSHSEPDG